MSWATRRSRWSGSSFRRAEQEPEPRTRRGEERFRADSRSSRSPPNCSRLGGKQDTGCQVRGYPNPRAKLAQSSPSVRPGRRVFLHRARARVRAPLEPEQGGKGEHSNGETEAGRCSGPGAGDTHHPSPRCRGGGEPALAPSCPSSRRRAPGEGGQGGLGSKTGCPLTSRNRPHAPPPPSSTPTSEVTTPPVPITSEKRLTGSQRVPG